MNSLKLIIILINLFWVNAMKEALFTYHSTFIFIINSPAEDKQDDPSFKQYYKAYQLVLDENWESSIKVFELLLKDFPKSKYIDDAIYWMAYATQEQGNFEKAIKLYLHFLDKFKDSNLVDDVKLNMKRLSKKLVAQGNAEYKKYIDTNDNIDYSENELKMEAIFAIYNTGTKSATKKLRSIAFGKKYSKKIREKALFWFGEMDNVAVKDLKELFDSIDDVRMKEKIIFSIYKKNNNESIELLIEIFKNKKTKLRLRKKAIFWILQKNPKFYSKHLSELINLTKGNLRLREKIVYGIAQSNLKNRSNLLYNFAIDSKESNSVREKAVFWLSQSKHKNTFELLKQLYAQITDIRLKEKLVVSFSQIQQDNDAAVDFMIKLLKLKSTPVRIKKKLIFWLGQSNSNKAKDAILKLID